MKILAFADIRTTLVLPDVEPDVVLLLGDVPSKMVYRIDKKYNCHKLGVLGNHCHPSNFNDSSVINMHGKSIVIDGMTFAGFEGVPPYKDREYGQHTETELLTFIRKLGDRHIDVLLMHSNPAYGDMELDHAHRGYESVNSMIFNNQVANIFHGHLHEPFIRTVEGTTIHSVYPYSWITDLPIKNN